jgi:hypothetical protein
MQSLGMRLTRSVLRERKGLKVSSFPERDLGISREYPLLVIQMLVCENFYEVQHFFSLAPDTSSVGDGRNKD